MIDSYRFGEFVIQGKTFKSNVILIDNTFKEARHLENHELKIDDFTELINSNPSYIIIGTGAYGVVKPQKEIIDIIESKGIKLVIEKTADACRKYNEFLKQGIKVAAFLHNTC